MRKLMDFRGIDCPEPLVKVVREFTHISKGDELVVLTDIPNCVSAIKDTVDVLEIASIEVVSKDSYYEIVIRIIKDV